MSRKGTGGRKRALSPGSSRVESAFAGGCERIEMQSAELGKIKELLALMEAHGLAEIELESKSVKIRLRKADEAPPQIPAGTPALLAAEGAAGNQPRLAGSGPKAAETETVDSNKYHTIVSPIVGTLYRAPAPDAEPFVEPGDPVDEDTVVCILEAMKVMNEVKAEVVGTVAKVLIENGRPVEYGQPLFLVSKA